MYETKKTSCFSWSKSQLSFPLFLFLTITRGQLQNRGTVEGQFYAFVGKKYNILVENDVELKLKFFNSYNENIRFTIEQKTNNSVSFLEEELLKFQHLKSIHQRIQFP